MSKVEIMGKVTRTFHKGVFKLRKYSPEILVAVGIVGVVGTTVIACKATTKLDDILDSHHDKVDKIHDAVEHPETLPEPYTEEDSKKDLTIVYAQTGFELAKLYAPAVGLGVLSITAILSGHNILKKRNLALAAAYTAVDKSFKEYRGRLIERFGEELDKELKYNVRKKDVEEIVVSEDGSETIVKKTVTVAEPNVSDYAKFFDEGCPGWTKDPEYNLMFLKDQERYANDLLKTRGHVFLNEVYDMVGIDRTKAGNVVGWYYDEKNPTGDNRIDFGIYNYDSERCRAFVNGYERTILLDFNVDGPILDLI